MAPLSDQEFAELALSVKTHEDYRLLSPIECARRIKDALETHSRAYLARRLTLSTSTMIGRFLGLLSLPEEYQELVSWRGRKEQMLGLDMAYRVSRLPSLDDQRALIESILEFDLKTDEVKEIEMIRKRNMDIPMSECISQVVTRRKVVVERELLVAQIQERVASVALQLPPDKRNAVNTAFRQELVGIIPIDDLFMAKAGAKRIFVMTSDQGKKALLHHAERTGLRAEELLNDMLMKSLKEHLDNDESKSVARRDSSSD